MTVDFSSTFPKVFHIHPKGEKRGSPTSKIRGIKTLTDNETV